MLIFLVIDLIFHFICIIWYPLCHFNNNNNTILCFVFEKVKELYFVRPKTKKQKKNPILCRIRKVTLFFDFRWWKPWTSPMSMSWQEELASMRRQTLISCVYRMMMGITRPRLSVFTISPERVSSWTDWDCEDGDCAGLAEVGYHSPMILTC